MEDRKLEKFSLCVKRLIVELVENRNNLQVHNSIDQFYYMQKLEELKILLENVNEASRQYEETSRRFENEYEQVFCQWQRDARFLNKLLRQELQVKP